MAKIALPSPPASYEELIEGQPSGEGGYPGCSERQHLRPGWPAEFGYHKYFRVVGFSDTLDQCDLSLRGIKSDWAACTARMLELVPDQWKRPPHFRKEFSEKVRATQIETAARGALQRFDRAALSILFLQAVLESGGIAWPLYRYVRLRPVTYYVEGFDQVLPVIESNAAALQTILRLTDQSMLVLRKMAEGHWYVTRKTADLTLRALQGLAEQQTVSAGLVAGLEVRCGRLRKRPDRNFWPVEQENVSFLQDEYLSPVAWKATPEAERARVKPPPFS
jgi:hypothetical protein